MEILHPHLPCKMLTLDIVSRSQRPKKSQGCDVAVEGRDYVLARHFSRNCQRHSTSVTFKRRDKGAKQYTDVY